MTTLEALAQSPARLAAGSVRTIALPQRFDVHEISRFESSINQLITAGTELMIDASGVRHMDRSAIDCLITIRLRCMDHGGDLTLVAPSVTARVILELSGRYDALNPIDVTDWQDDLDSLDEVAA